MNWKMFQLSFSPPSSRRAGINLSRMRNRSAEIDFSFGWEKKCFMCQTIFAFLQGKAETWTEGCPDESSVGKWLFINVLWRNLKDEGCFWKIPWRGVFGAAAEETKVVSFFIFGLNAVQLLAEYRKSWKKNIPNPCALREIGVYLQQSRLSGLPFLWIVH